MADILFVPLGDNTTDSSILPAENGPKPWWESSWIAFASLVFFSIAIFCVVSLLWAWGTGRINHKGDWLRWANHDARERRRNAANPPPPTYNEAMDTTTPPARRTWRTCLTSIFNPFFAWLDDLSVRFDSRRDRRRQEAEARHQDAATHRANRVPRGYVESDPYWPRHADGRLWDFERDGDSNSYGGVRACNPESIWWPQPVLAKWKRRGRELWGGDEIVMGGLGGRGMNDGAVLGGLARQGL